MVFQNGGIGGLEVVSLCFCKNLYFLLLLRCFNVAVVFYSLREISVPFPTESEAQIACNSLSVDHEPKRSRVKKELTVKGNVLHA